MNRCNLFLSMQDVKNTLFPPQSENGKACFHFPNGSIWKYVKVKQQRISEKHYNTPARKRLPPGSWDYSENFAKNNKKYV